MTIRPWLVTLGCCAMLGLGVGLILESAPPPTTLTPLPDTSVATPVPSGPSVATLTRGTFTPDDMSAGTLFIPSIEVYSDIVETSRRGAELVLPASAQQVVRWDESASLEARRGNTLLAGHVAYHGENGIFHQLGTIEVGARLYIRDTEGQLSSYVLSTRHTYAKDAGLPESVWTTSITARTITVVSCAGKVSRNGSTWHWSDNLVLVFIPT